jgi:hypothetical protein
LPNSRNEGTLALPLLSIEGDGVSRANDRPMSENEPRSGWRTREGGGFCAEKTRLQDAFLKTMRELMALQTQQTQALIDGDPDFSRFDVLIHLAGEQKDLAKYALISHIETHGCWEGAEHGTDESGKGKADG